ncbi:ABC transporter ATP-binding protein [Thiomicrorhabdus sp.]|uniref:ABC transporter ATP-binding protein n=1 Tax=Thiomicrorhabdus sp. TaxID=2039724 RepID=UPI0029C92F3B|nr:ABC transporter ATP-binding protein [Thiomicrorhabdus sp.]
MASHPQTQTMQSIPSLAQSYRRMLQAAGDEAPALRRSFQYTVLSSVMQGLAFASLYPLMEVLLSQPFDLNQLWFWLGLLGLFALLDWVFRWKAHEFGYSEKLANVTHEMRVKLGLHLRNMPLQSLYKSRTGELSTVIAGNVDEIITPMGNVSEMFIRGLVVPIVVVIATAFINWQLALALLLIFPMMIPIYRWIRKAKGRSMRELANAHADTASEIVEYVQGLPVLRAANATGGKSERLQTSLAHLQRIQEKSQLKSVMPNLLLWTWIEGGIILVLAIGVYFILGGAFSIAALAALLIISVRLSESVAILTNVTSVLDFMEAGFEKIEKFLAIQSLAVQQPKQTPKHFDIAFKELTFGYSESDTPELSRINLTLPERSMTALVGPSGSGKTTLTRMIMRYADPQQGQVTIGGIDIRAMSQEALMSHISVVFQDIYLFDDTVLNNIRMGKPNATDAEVEAAARSAHCHEFISRLPHGYRTQIGDIGGTLSGGERQRISIARAILKDAPIVMLDEPTAALDTESELAVQQAIDELVKNRTVIVIAHRLSTIVGADQIVVLEEGQIVQSGKHAELIEQSGRYQAMWRAQQGVKNWHLQADSLKGDAFEK